MARTKGRKIKDKWREKVWINAIAPDIFNNRILANIPITSDKKSLGRVISTTLYDLIQGDHQNYSVKLSFQIQEINDNKALTLLKGYEYSREYLRSLIRRGSSSVSFIKDYVTADGYKVRLYFIGFGQGRINTSKKHAIRGIVDNILKSKSESQNYNELTQDIIFEKLSSEISKDLQKIVHLRKVAIRKFKLIKISPVSDDNDVEKQTIDPLTT
jgi:small subunit ribosomal protein S3Ae